jgi:O-antigen/teichoic acid export membrane protein
LRRDSRADVGLTAGTNVALAALNAGSGVLLARALGPDGRGEVAAIQLWGMFLATLALMGIQDAVVYYAARTRHLAGRYAISAAALGLLASVPVVVAGWFLIPLVLASQSDSTKELARLFLLFVPIYAVSTQPGQALRGLGSFGRWNFLRILPAFLWVVVVVAAIVVDQRTPAFMTIGFLVLSLVTLGASVWVAAPVVEPPYDVRTHTWRPLLGYGLPLLLATIPHWLNIRLDQMLLAAFVSSRDLGLYVVAVAWAGLVAPLVNAFGIVLFPRLARETDEGVRVEVLYRGLRATLVVTTTLTVVMLILTPFAIRVFFGAAFGEATPAAAVLVLATAALAVNFVLEEGFRGLGRPGEVLRAEVMGLVVTGAALAVLLRPLGIVGAALASLVGYTATTAVLGRRLRATTGQPALAAAVPRGDDVRVVWASLAELVRKATRRR